MLAPEYLITQIGEVLEVARSTWYHRRAPLEEQEVRQAIAAVAGEWPRYGYRRITKQLQRQGWIETICGYGVECGGVHGSDEWVGLAGLQNYYPEAIC